MNTYENTITVNAFGSAKLGPEYYLATDYVFDKNDTLQLSHFSLWDQDGEEVPQDGFEANLGLYAHVCTILANEDAICYGGTPC